MGKLINLRRIRKQKQRESEAAAAAENRTKHGRSRAEKQRASLLRGLEDLRIEAHRREPKGPEGPTEDR
jgi:hypothetical protein